MPIYRGFGDGLLDDYLWGLPDSARRVPAPHAPVMLAFDKALGYYKNLGSMRSWNLLTKVPVGIEKYRAVYCALPDAEVKLLEEAYREVSSVWEEQGFPQPLNKNLSRIVSWRVPFSRFDGKYIYADFKHNLHCRFAQDPGRFFFAWTLRKGLEIREEECLVLCDPVIGCLAIWLVGLNGVKIRVLRGKEMDWRQVKYSESTRSVLKTRFRTELGLNEVTGVTFVVNSALTLSPPTATSAFGKALDLDSYQTKSSLFSSDTSSPVPPSSSKTKEQEENKSTRRRAPPPPPAPPAYSRQARAKFPFAAESDDELGFQADDVLEIIGEGGGDGWMEASLKGRRGFVPKEYLEWL